MHSDWEANTSWLLKPALTQGKQGWFQVSETFCRKCSDNNACQWPCDSRITGRKECLFRAWPGLITSKKYYLFCCCCSQTCFLSPQFLSSYYRYSLTFWYLTLFLEIFSKHLLCWLKALFGQLTFIRNTAEKSQLCSCCTTVGCAVAPP